MPVKQPLELRPKSRRFRTLVVEQTADVSQSPSCFTDATARVQHWLILKNNDWYAKWRFRLSYTFDSLGALCCESSVRCAGGATEATRSVIVTGNETINYWAGARKDIAQIFCWRCGSDERNMNLAVHFRAEPDDIAADAIDETFVTYVEKL